LHIHSFPVIVWHCSALRSLACPLFKHPIYLFPQHTMHRSVLDKQKSDKTGNNEEENDPVKSKVKNTYGTNA